MLQRWNYSTRSELLLKRRVYCKYVNSVTINLCIHFILSTQLCQAYDLSELMYFIVCWAIFTEPILGWYDFSIEKLPLFMKGFLENGTEIEIQAKLHV